MTFDEQYKLKRLEILRENLERKKWMLVDIFAHKIYLIVLLLVILVVIAGVIRSL